MKIVILIFMLGFVVSSADASQRMRTHIRKSGKVVMPHYRTSKDSYTFNNWSTKGNTNPMTGKKGTRSPYKTKRLRLY